jgi:hypothetical protein
MPREIFIVARDRPDLYRYLGQTFADAENVQVIWDRRDGDRRVPMNRRQGGEGRESEATGERRRLAAGRSVDRRRAERRARATVEQELRSVGYAFITIP